MQKEQSLKELLDAFTKSVNRDWQPEQVAATCYECKGEGINCPYCSEGIVIVSAEKRPPASGSLKTIHNRVD